jgi:hypothetical protein
MNRMHVRGSSQPATGSDAVMNSATNVRYEFRSPSDQPMSSETGTR